jgi:hypothetical protein
MLVLLAYVAVVELVHAVDPSVPFVMVPHEKFPMFSESVIVTELPMPVEVTVTALPLKLVVAGKPWLMQLSSAVLKLLAAVAEVLLLRKLPLVELVQAFELSPPVSAAPDQLNPLDIL